MKWLRIGGRHMYLWRAVDDEGEVLDVLVQRRRDKADPEALANRGPGWLAYGFGDDE